jgi:hypothetical protein
LQKAPLSRAIIIISFDLFGFAWKWKKMFELYFFFGFGDQGRICLLGPPVSGTVGGRRGTHSRLLHFRANPASSPPLPFFFHREGIIFLALHLSSASARLPPTCWQQQPGELIPASKRRAIYLFQRERAACRGDDANREGREERLDALIHPTSHSH